MYCPKCGKEYREGFYRCNDCGVSLAERAQPVKQGPITGYEALMATMSSGDLFLLSSAMEKAGIEFIFKSAVPMDFVVPQNPVVLLVKKEDVMKAASVVRRLKLAHLASQHIF